MALMRKLHKWISLLVGVQVLLWLTSGLVISLLDPAKVSGAQWRVPVQAIPGTIPSVPILEPFELRAEHLRGALSINLGKYGACLLYTSPSPRDRQKSRMPSSA